MIAKVRSSATKSSSKISNQRCLAEARRYKSGKAPGLKTRATETSFQSGGEGGAEVRGSFYGADAGGSHRGVLVLGGALAASDNRASMAHAASRRGGLPGDEADDGLLHVGLDPLRGAFFRVAADFADQDDG